MRIAFYAPRASCLKPGDFGHCGFVRALLAVLHERGHEVGIVSRVNVRDFPRGRLPARRLIAEARSIRQAMKRFAPEVWLVYGTSVKNPDLFGWWQHPKHYLLINQEGRGGRELPQGWRWLFGSVHRRSLARADQDNGVSAKEPLVLEIEQALQQTRLRRARPDRERDSLASDQALYLDLLKKCLTRYIFPETYRPNHPSRGRFKRVFYAGLQKLLAFDNLALVRHESFDPDARAKGRDFPLEAETMIGLEGLSNLQYCITDVLKRGVAGDLIETGIWRGGATAFMRAVLKAFGDTQRIVWAADSFQGVPQGRYVLRAGERLQQQVSLDEVQANFARYGLLDDQVRFLVGWFRDTLPVAPIERLAVLRFDADMYEVTMDVLVNLYEKLSISGYVIIGSYGREGGCTAAVDDFRQQRGITEPMQRIGWEGVYWQRLR